MNSAVTNPINSTANNSINRKSNTKIVLSIALRIIPSIVNAVSNSVGCLELILISTDSTLYTIEPNSVKYIKTFFYEKHTIVYDRNDTFIVDFG